MFDIEHSKIQVSSNEVPGVTNGHALRYHDLIYVYIMKKV